MDDEPGRGGVERVAASGVELVDPLLVLVADPDDPAAVDSDGVRVGVLGGDPIGLEDPAEVVDVELVRREVDVAEELALLLGEPDARVEVALEVERDAVRAALAKPVGLPRERGHLRVHLGDDGRVLEVVDAVGLRRRVDLDDPVPPAPVPRDLVTAPQVDPDRLGGPVEGGGPGEFLLRRVAPVEEVAVAADQLGQVEDGLVGRRGGRARRLGPAGIDEQPEVRRLGVAGGVPNCEDERVIALGESRKLVTQRSVDRGKVGPGCERNLVLDECGPARLVGDRDADQVVQRPERLVGQVEPDRRRGRDGHGDRKVGVRVPVGGVERRIGNRRRDGVDHDRGAGGDRVAGIVSSRDREVVGAAGQVVGPYGTWLLRDASSGLPVNFVAWPTRWSVTEMISWGSSAPTCTVNVGCVSLVMKSPGMPVSSAIALTRTKLGGVLSIRRLEGGPGSSSSFRRRPWHGSGVGKSRRASHGRLERCNCHWCLPVPSEHVARGVEDFDPQLGLA